MNAPEMNHTVSGQPTSVTIGLRITAADWQKYIMLKAASTAAERAYKEHARACGIPSGNDIASQLDLPEGGMARGVVVDGNNRPIGKVAVFYVDPHPVAGCFKARYS